MGRLRLPKRRLECPWGEHQVSAAPMIYGLLDPKYERAVAQACRQGKIVHLGCMMMPWRWWCPECQFPIPSEDGNWFDMTEEQRDAEIRSLGQAWEEEQRRRRKMRHERIMTL